MIDNKKHGGKRKGSGRKKKYGEPTKTIRVPVSKIPKILEICKQL